MKKATVPESKIFTTDKKSPPKKNEPKVSAAEPGGSLLKKNEFTIILIAALVVTALVFFFFFRGSSTQPKVEQESVSASGTDHQTAPGFENRISALEVSLAKLASSPDQNENQASSRAMSDLDERITRIATAVNLKLDTLIERVDKLEGRLNKLPVAASPPPPNPIVTSEPEVKMPAVPEKKVLVKKKEAGKPKKTSQFHTVQKGETLWSIAQKYKTTVAAIRKLNNLTPIDKIYPGSNLLVR